jgi:hypothetical protein
VPRVAPQPHDTPRRANHSNHFAAHTSLCEAQQIDDALLPDCVASPSMALPCQSQAGSQMHASVWCVRAPRGDESSTIYHILRITRISSVRLRVHAASRRATKHNNRALQYGLSQQLMHDATAAVNCP